MKKFLIVSIALLLLSLARPAQAQATQAVWTAPDNLASIAQAPLLEYRLYVNNGPAVLLTGVSCTGTVITNITCQATLPAGVPQVIGTRYEVTAKETNSVESPRSIPFIQPAHAPTNPRTQ